MPVIKGDQDNPGFNSAIVLDMGDLERQAEQLIALAEEKANAMITSAGEEAKVLANQMHKEAFDAGRVEGLEQGRSEGRQQGYDAALEEASRQFEELQGNWQRTLQRLNIDHETLLREAKDDVLTLAVRLAELLIHRAIDLDPTVIADQLRQALCHVLSRVEVTVKINPDDRLTLEKIMPQFTAAPSQFQAVHLVDDASVARGGCLVQHGQGGIDATIDTQLERIIAQLMPDADVSEPSADLDLRGNTAPPRSQVAPDAEGQEETVTAGDESESSFSP